MAREFRKRLTLNTPKGASRSTLEDKKVWGVLQKSPPPCTLLFRPQTPFHRTPVSAEGARALRRVGGRCHR